MRDGLNATNRSIFFSLCGWETWYAPEGKSLANSWRIGPDDGNWPNIIKNIDLMDQVAQFAGPSKGWNDPCLLVSADWTGRKLITELQTRAQFSMWSVMAVRLFLLSHTYLIASAVVAVCHPPASATQKVLRGFSCLGSIGSATDLRHDTSNEQLHA
eukprot:COSAG02_NODE_3975_length_5965_cov_5.092226_3_plen_157_part_00